MAVLRDPDGAQVSVWQAGLHQGCEVQGEPGAPIWSELVTRDAAGARLFYGEVFGWIAEEQEFGGVPYTVWKRGGQLVGAALEMDDSWPEATHPHWLVAIALPAARRQRPAAAVRHRPGSLRPARGSRRRRVLDRRRARVELTRKRRYAPYAVR
jgi:predicted enzyme related to lactoylglutathione lyase